MEKSENFSVDGNQNIKKNIGSSSEQSAMDTSQKFGVLGEILNEKRNQ